MKIAYILDRRYAHIAYEQCKLVAANVAMEDLSGANEEQVGLTLLVAVNQRLKPDRWRLEWQEWQPVR